MATVNRPTDIKQKEADVNRKLQIYGIINAFQNGKVPSVRLPAYLLLFQAHVEQYLTDNHYRTSKSMWH